MSTWQWCSQASWSALRRAASTSCSYLSPCPGRDRVTDKRGQWAPLSLPTSVLLLELGTNPERCCVPLSGPAVHCSVGIVPGERLLSVLFKLSWADVWVLTPVSVVLDIHTCLWNDWRKGHTEMIIKSNLMAAAAPLGLIKWSVNTSKTSLVI